MSDLPPYDLQAFQPPPSLWKLVEENVSPEEREEIREILGDSLIEQSLELHSEVDILLEIWREFREETSCQVSQTSPLPEPPQVRESLINHIRLLLGSLKDKKDGGRDSGIVLSDCNSDVIDYVMHDMTSSTGSSPSSTPKRPSTAASVRDGRDTPLRLTPCSDTDMLSMSSTISDQVESVKDHLNILQIDEVVLQLRKTLEDEIEMLLRDITFLQNCLEEESDFRSKSVMSICREPSIHDLKEERSKLQKAVESVPEYPIAPRVKKTLPPTRKLPAPLKLNNTRRRPPASYSNTTTKTSPIKASHNIVQAATITLPSNTSTVSGVRNTRERVVVVNSSPSPPLRPSPPSSAKSSRPTSADRFRRMVLDHRQGAS